MCVRSRKNLFRKVFFRGSYRLPLDLFALNSLLLPGSASYSPATKSHQSP